MVFLEPDGSTILSEFNYGEQVEDTSFGELVENNTFGFFDEPTPGKANTTQQFASAPGEEIQFDKTGGLFSGSIQLTILPPESPNAVIRYTTNNSEPSSRSPIYNGRPITIRETTTIRARIFESGREPSKVRSRTFIELNSNVVNFNSALPIIVVDSNGANLDDGNRNFRFTYNVVIDKDPKDGLARMTGPTDFQGRSGMHVRGQSSSGSPKNNTLGKLITMKERTKMNQFLECLKSQIGLYMLPTQIKLSCEMCLSTISPETYGEIKVESEHGLLSSLSTPEEEVMCQ